MYIRIRQFLGYFSYVEENQNSFVKKKTPTTDLIKTTRNETRNETTDQAL